MKTPADTDEIEDECLRQCYHAFLARRVARGGRSLRTRRGFEKLRANYQPRVGFLLDHVGNDPIQVKLTSVSDTAGEGGESLKELVGPFVDERIIRFVADVCWPLAHFGPAYNDKPRMVLHIRAFGVISRLIRCICPEPCSVCMTPGFGMAGALSAAVFCHDGQRAALDVSRTTEF